MNYTNREVVRRLKQYDMFLNSLNLATEEVQKERICDQLDKIEKQILLETNVEYEEEYMVLFSEEAKFFPEEKSRLRKLISLIMDRRSYLDDRKNKHKNITGSLVELTTFLGEDKLTVFKKRLEIIEKYEENKSRGESLIKEMKLLDVKLSEASRSVKANTRLNDILENKMKDIVNKALEKYKLYSLTAKKDDIYRNYENYKYALELAENNLKSARTLGNDDYIFECDNMLSEINKDYSKYNEMINVLKLIDIYDKSVNGYDELLEKRESMDEILKNISDSELYKEIFDELNKQYNTIKLEKKDIDNYESLKLEREKKNKTLYELDEENNSKEFKLVIDELVRNENRVREEKVRKAKREEFQERQKKLLEEQKIEASRVKRQKLIEEARLKEQQERLKKVKELQEKTVINPKKEVEKPIIKEETLDILKEEKINNPLKNKTLDEVMLYSDNFDTDELFENTKIVPNKALNDKKSILDDALTKEDVVLWEAPSLFEEVLTEPKEETVEETSNEDDVYQKLDDLFNEQEEVKEVVSEDVKEEIAVEVKDEVVEKENKPSIYDILENNKNIIWKTTDTNVNKDSIPVIGNNNLKPEILENKNVNDITFPKLESKEGDILWKETL